MTLALFDPARFGRSARRVDKMEDCPLCGHGHCPQHGTWHLTDEQELIAAELKEAAQDRSMTRVIRKKLRND
jgi:hypothetical protein